jgi:hypothetical protein
MVCNIWDYFAHQLCVLRLLFWRPLWPFSTSLLCIIHLRYPMYHCHNVKL